MDIDKLLADSSGDSEETVATKETVSSEETAVVPAGNDKPVKKTKKKGKPRGGNNWLKPENIAPGLEAGDIVSIRSTPYCKSQNNVVSLHGGIIILILKQEYEV